jgi:hypothetical protein
MRHVSDETDSTGYTSMLGMSSAEYLSSGIVDGSRSAAGRSSSVDPTRSLLVSSLHTAVDVALAVVSQWTLFGHQRPQKVRHTLLRKSRNAF